MRNFTENLVTFIHILLYLFICIFVDQSVRSFTNPSLIYHAIEYNWRVLRNRAFSELKVVGTFQESQIVLQLV